MSPAERIAMVARELNVSLAALLEMRVRQAQALRAAQDAELGAYVQRVVTEGAMQR